MGEIIANKIRVQRTAERASPQNGQRSPRAVLALKNLYLSVLHLEECAKHGFDTREMLDIELMRDRLSRIYDKARGIS